MSRGVRIRGVVLVVLGLFLAVAMAMLSAHTYEAMEPAIGRPGGARFTGTPEQANWILTLYTAVFVFGVVFALYGLFMAVSGRQSRVMEVAAVILLALMIGAAFLLRDAPRLIGQLF